MSDEKRAAFLKALDDLGVPYGVTEHSNGSTWWVALMEGKGMPHSLIFENDKFSCFEYAEKTCCCM